MKYSIVLLLSFLSMSFFAFAEDSDLNIRVDAIKNRQNVYISAADFLGIDIFTSKSAKIENQYNAILEGRRQQKILDMFAETNIDARTERERIQMESENRGLFAAQFDANTYHRPIGEEDARQYNPVIIFLAVALLCFLGFLFSRHRYKQKKRRNHANNNHY